MVSFDEQLPETEAAMHATSHLSEVSSYDVAWASSIVHASVEQHSREICIAEGKGEWFDELGPFVAGGHSGHAESRGSRKQLGTRVENLRVWLSRLRQRYRTPCAPRWPARSPILTTSMTNFTMFSES